MIMVNGLPAVLPASLSPDTDSSRFLLTPVVGIAGKCTISHSSSRLRPRRMPNSSSSNNIDNINNISRCRVIRSCSPPNARCSRHSALSRRRPHPATPAYNNNIANSNNIGSRNSRHSTCRGREGVLHRLRRASSTLKKVCPSGESERGGGATGR
jgi:hypothetical protein